MSDFVRLAMHLVDLERRLSQCQQSPVEQYDIDSLAVFGSVARGEATTESDLDLLVRFNKPVGLLHLIGAEQYLAAILNVPKVDLVLRDHVIEELQPQIYSEAIDVFSSKAVEVPASSHA